MSYIFGDYDMLLRIPVKTQFSCMSCSKCTTEEKTITPKEFGIVRDIEISSSDKMPPYISIHMPSFGS